MSTQKQNQNIYRALGKILHEIHCVRVLIFKWLLLVCRFAGLISICFVPPSHSVTISCILVVLCRLESIFPRICSEPTMRPFSFAVVIAEVTAIFGLQAQTLAQGQSVRGGPVSELKFIWLQSLCFYCTRQFEWISVTIDTDCGQPVTWKKCPFGCILKKNPTVKEPITITYGYKHESRCSLNSY